MYAGKGGGRSIENGRVSRAYADVDATKCLLAAGADPNIEDANGGTALSKAEEGGERAVVAVLRRVGARGLREQLAGTPGADLFYAVRTQDMGAVKRLIRGGARVAVQDKKGMTPLMYAAMQYDGILIHYLLRHAPDVSAALELKDSMDLTALDRSGIFEYSYSELQRAGAVDRWK